MPVELKIKVCGMRDPDNIRDLSECRPDLIGFIFYSGSKRYVAEPAPGLMNEIPGPIRKVGVFVNEPVNDVKQVARHLGIGLVQLHGEESPEYCRELHDEGIQVMKVFRISQTMDNERMKDYEASCEFFLFDTYAPVPGGTGEHFEWKALDHYKLQQPFFLSGGIGPEDVSRILKLDHPALAGVDINSRFELKPGLKDISKVNQFIQLIRREIR